MAGDAQLRVSVKSSFTLAYMPSLKITAGEPGMRSSQPMRLSVCTLTPPASTRLSPVQIFKDDLPLGLLLLP